VTLHDTILWDEVAPNRARHHYVHRVLPAALLRSAGVITISESSRRDILARWPRLEAKLHVVPHGISDEFFSIRSETPHAALNETIGSANYIVYVGGPVPRKRFDWALKLLEQCGRPDLRLIACGFNSESLPRHQVPEDLRHRIHFAPFLTDAELIALYRGAAAVLYPTLYEGFGFPAIEAQVAGAPVLFSPVSSLAELIGPLAWQVEAHSMESWVKALEDVLALSADARRARAQEAREWGRAFSWERSFDRHLDVYSAALGRAAASSRPTISAN
jgi:alpha-1,3-rhamnosyl/mannosyltransferase